MRLVLAATLALLAGRAGADVPAVVTDIPIVQSLVAQVMGDLGVPDVVAGGGADPHDYQLRPSQARALAGADVIVWIGPAMTPWMTGTVADSPAPAKLSLLDVPGTHLRQFTGQDEAEEDHDHADGDDHDEDHDEAGDRHHHHTGLDPHAWLDPANARLWLAAIAELLAGADPDNAAGYRANAEAASQDIAALDAELAKRTAAVKAGLVVSHDAYGYFAEHFGLTIVGSLAEGDASQPGAARISGLKQRLMTDGAVCVFPEARHDPKPILALADGTSAVVGAPLDPEGLDLAPGAALYGTLLRNLVATIADCAG